jgi:predicted ATPase/DNA-binding SARP family transcriptional activator
VWVGVLGPLTVRLDGRDVEVAGGRLRALLARLAVEPDRRVSSAELVAAVWPDDAPAEPVNSLQSLVSRLRRALGDPALVIQETTGYRLRLTSANLDAAVFADQVRRAHEALRSGRDDLAYELLCSALALWRGDPLADVGEGDYRQSYVGRWAEDRLQAIKDRSAIRLRQGEAGGLSGELEELLGAHPFDESLMLLLLQSLVAVGRLSEALARYERFRRFVADELGADPGRELQDLHLQLLRGDGVSSTASAPPHRRSNLRSWLTSFVGREADVDRVLASVRANRLTTVVGPGGTGKTRLATEAAARWLAERTEPAWLVELAPVTEAANIPVAILGALGVRDARLTERGERGERPAPEALDRLLDVLRGSGALLVIDNCEHLIEPAAAIIDTILARAPDVRVLATSREPLALIGEGISPLPPLAQPPAGSTAAEASDFPAVQLWLDRARVVRPDFVLDDESVAPVIEIVRRLDGLPLAIELAAARLRVLPVDEIARRLSDRFRLLTGGNRAGLPRHRTLRAVVEWSWDLLTEQERLLAERLAVFPAGADVAGATAICADDRLPAAEIDSLLLSLVEKSLLQSIDSAGPTRSFRFRMLETIREYGVERLAERDELEAARIAHGRYFADMVIDLEPVIRSADQLSAIRTLEVERDNILAALRFLGDSGRPVQALHVALALVWYWSLIGSSSEAMTWLSFVIAVNEADPPPELIFARAGLALSLLNRGEDGAETEPTELVDWQQTVDELTDLATRLLEAPAPPFPGLEALGPMVAHFADQDDLADAMVERGLASPDRWVRAALLANMAFSAENDSDPERMRTTAAEAYTEFLEIGDRWGISSCLLVLARMSTLDGRLDEAERQYEQAWTCLTELGGSDDDDIYLRIRLADVYARRGEWDRARSTLTPAPSRDRPPGDRELFAEACLASIEWMAGEGDHALARARRLRGRLVDRGVNTQAMHHVPAVVLSTSGGLEAALGDLGQARADLDEAYVAGVASKDMPILCLVGMSVAAYAIALGQPDSCATILGAAAQVRGGDDFRDPLVIMLTDQVRSSGSAFEVHYARGRELDRTAAIRRLDPAQLDRSVAVAQARRR